MNKTFIRKDDETFVVSTEEGNQFIFNIDKDTTDNTVNEILSIENELEELNNDNHILYSSKNNIDARENVSKILYLFGIPSIILSYSGISFLSNVSVNETLIGALVLSGIMVPLNMIINGTYISRKKKVSKIDLAINNNNKIIDKLTDKIDLLKEQVNFKEVDKQPIHIIEPINRSYEYQETKVLTKKLIKK